MNRQAHSKRDWLFLLMTMGLLLVGYLNWNRRHNRSLAPPEGVHTLEQFASVMPAPLYLRVGGTPEKEYLVWTAPLKSTASLSSGPPGYAFDQTGALVDWTADQGDDLGFREKWPTDPVHPIALEDAMKRFRSR